MKLQLMNSGTLMVEFEPCEKPGAVAFLYTVVKDCKEESSKDSIRQILQIMEGDLYFTSETKH